MKTKRAAQQGTSVAAAPRLIKADAVAAREAEEAARAVHKATIRRSKESGPNPALKRTPRNAMEARDMFKALFNEAA
jgi:hypothetical protein